MIFFIYLNGLKKKKTEKLTIDKKCKSACKYPPCTDELLKAKFFKYW